MGKGERERKSVGVLLGGRTHVGSFDLRDLKAGSFGDVLGEGLNRIFINFSVCCLSGL